MSRFSSENLPDDELLGQCEVETRRASGPGGQHRNKTESAVRLLHRPTGIVVQASERRSQGQNLAVALERLRAALEQHFAPPPPPRVATRPSRSARAERREEKALRGRTKALRGRVRSDD